MTGFLSGGEWGRRKFPSLSGLNLMQFVEERNEDPHMSGLVYLHGTSDIQKKIEFQYNLRKHFNCMC